jgi:superfamily I DNA and/or RNA helicase
VVIVTTISTDKLDKKLKEEQTFKPYIGILDESSQASWANTYCFLVKEIKKFVLAGDDKQLSPVVISQS